MSGGTLIALAADEIQLDRHAALGPVDPQLGQQLGQHAARSLVELASMPGQHNDQTLLMADLGRKALRQVKATVQGLLQKRPRSSTCQAHAFPLRPGRSAGDGRR